MPSRCHVVTPREPFACAQGRLRDRGGRNAASALDAVDFEDGYGIGDTGFAGRVGAGYELRPCRRVCLNPVIDFVDHRYSNRLGGSYRERLVNFGVGILLHTGR